MAVNDYAMDIVKFFRRKTANGFDSVTYLGTEQRFVEALSNSNNNNLEEQLLLGTDTYTETYYDSNGNQIIEKSFKKEGENTNYYKLVTIVYKEENRHNDDFYFDEDQIYMLNENNSINYIAVNSELNFANNSFISFYTDSQGNENIKVTPNTFTSLWVDTLYYIDNNGDSILVATKNTGMKLTSDGKQVFREIVKNKLGVE